MFEGNSGSKQPIDKSSLRRVRSARQAMGPGEWADIEAWPRLVRRLVAGCCPLRWREEAVADVLHELWMASCSPTGVRWPKAFAAHVVKSWCVAARRREARCATADPADLQLLPGRVSKAVESEQRSHRQTVPLRGARQRWLVEQVMLGRSHLDMAQESGLRPEKVRFQLRELADRLCVLSRRNGAT